jgi:S1-C subfamily serine protease
VIVAVDGESVNAEDDLAEHVLKRSPGDTLNLRVMRGDEPREIEITLGVLPEQTD